MKNNKYTTHGLIEILLFGVEHRPSQQNHLSITSILHIWVDWSLLLGGEQTPSQQSHEVSQEYQTYSLIDFLFRVQKTPSQ
jgi:hypothetical protein